MGYWAVAQLVPNRTSLALHTLAQQNFTVYAPKIRELRVIRGHKTDVFSGNCSPPYCGAHPSFFAV
jgi:hypothetical protein